MEDNEINEGIKSIKRTWLSWLNTKITDNSSSEDKSFFTVLAAKVCLYYIKQFLYKKDE